MKTQATGQRGEDLAAEFLERQGLVVMERNYRFERAEVDLVCFEPAERYESGGMLVFVEVKTRRGTGFGLPEEAISAAKRRNISHAARAFLYERQLEGSPCRFDVVSILMDGDAPQVRHIRNAFTESG